MPSAIDRRLRIVLIVEQKLEGEWALRGSKSISFELPEAPVTVEQLESLRAQVAEAFNSGELNALGQLSRTDRKRSGNLLDGAAQ